MPNIHRRILDRHFSEIRTQLRPDLPFTTILPEKRNNGFADAIRYAVHVQRCLLERNQFARDRSDRKEQTKPLGLGFVALLAQNGIHQIFDAEFGFVQR